MLILNSADCSGIPRATLALNAEEALELIEKVAHLIRNPKYHHDHIEDYGSAALDLLIIDPEQIDTYSEGLRVAIREWLARQGRSRESE